jgi:hypothetical protein
MLIDLLTNIGQATRTSPRLAETLLNNSALTTFVADYSGASKELASLLIPVLGNRRGFKDLRVDIGTPQKSLTRGAISLE